MLVAAVAVLVISPKDLPRAMRTVGQWIGQVRRVARSFQAQVNEAIRDTEFEDVRRDIDKLGREVGKIDPMAGVRSDLAKTDAAIRDGLAEKPGGQERPAGGDTGPAEEAEVQAQAETEAEVEAGRPAVKDGAGS